jgi:hypothetical protein
MGHQQMRVLAGNSARIYIVMVIKNTCHKQNAASPISMIGRAVGDDVLVVYVRAWSARACF